MNEFDFEKDLKQEMRRVDAPEGFADRVMQRAAQQRRGRLLTFGQAGSQARHWMAVAAVLLVAVIFGFGIRQAEQVQRQRLEEARAKAAAQQFALAMQVTSRTLFVVQQRIDKAGAKDSRGID